MSDILCRPRVIRVPSPSAPSCRYASAPSPARIVRVPVPADPSVVRRDVPGIPGPAGKDASVTPLARPVAGEPIRAGQPVTLDRTTGHALLATAALYARAFVAGFAGADAEAGHPVSIVGRLLTLDDWTAGFGATDLPAGMSLFLALAPGRLVMQSPADPGQSTVALGYAAGPRTVAISLSPPILR